LTKKDRLSFRDLHFGKSRGSKKNIREDLGRSAVPGIRRKEVKEPKEKKKKGMRENNIYRGENGNEYLHANRSSPISCGWSKDRKILDQ